MKKVPEYFIIHKPYGVLSQFSDEAGHPGLGSLFRLKKDIYPVGRLDRDSEGLLILTNDKTLNHKLLSPENSHERTYHVEVNGHPTVDSLGKLSAGVELNIKGKKYRTRPCKARIVNLSPEEREPPVNRIKHPETCWLELKLVEGKNRQVRKMTAYVGHPTLRLIRAAIEDLTLGDLKPGGIVKISRRVIYEKLNISLT